MRVDLLRPITQMHNHLSGGKNSGDADLKTMLETFTIRH